MPINHCPNCFILFARECPECGRPCPAVEEQFAREQQSDDPTTYTPDFDGIDAVDY